MDACLTDIANTGPCICLLACMVPAAIGMGMENFIDGVYDRYFPSVTCFHHAFYRPYAYAFGHLGV